MEDQAPGTDQFPTNPEPTESQDPELRIVQPQNQWFV